jgi:hypothetical protein
MPSAFVGKRTSDRIAEVTGTGEKEDDVVDASDKAAHQAGAIGSDTNLGRTSSERRKMKLNSSSSLPLAVPEETSNKFGAPGDEVTASMRDSRSTAGTRSSFDFGSSVNASSPDSSAAPCATTDVNARRDGGIVSERQSSTGVPTSTGHSNSNSITSLGAQQPLTASELAQAAQDLSQNVMNTTSTHVICTPVQDDTSSLGSGPGHTATSSTSSVSTWPSSAASPYSPYSPFGGQAQRQLPQLPYPGNGTDLQGKGNYPYQHYAQGFGQDLNGGFNGINFPAMSSNGNFGSTTSLGSTLGQQQQSGASLLGPSLSSDSKSGQGSNSKIPRYNFHLSGTFLSVMEARAMIMREHPFRSQVSVKVGKADVIDNASSSTIGPNTLKSHVRARLDEIASFTDTRIAVVGKDSRGADLGYGLESERNVDLVISGQLQGVESARVRTLVLLDELIGLTSTTCEIDQKFHNIIGGRKRHVIQAIQEQTCTSIYLPLPLGSNVGGAGLGPTSSLESVIHITGDFFGVQRARDMLYGVFVQKSKCTISRETRILPRKIDWLLSDHLEDVRQIMIDNGTFIGLPALGSQEAIVSVYGDNRVSIERSIRTLMALTCQFYLGSVWLLPPVGSYHGGAQPTPTVNAAHLTPFLKTIVNKSGAEVVFKNNCFEIYGVEVEVKHAVSMVLDLDFVKQFTVEVRFQIELAATERDFLQGRKCGKINKIMKTCGVRIKFETFNDFNFLIELSGADRASVLQGLALLQEELPAEVSFHVPEAYHKRCIGVGGKQIQKVMKKYGVYVKFSNAEEFNALGGYIDNEDNVIARTPAKNAINLENLKQSVMEMVNPKDKDYITETVTIPRRHHRTLLGEKGIFIHDIENKFSCAIHFPPRETCSDLVSIFGPEIQLQQASSMLMEHVPVEAELRTPNATALPQVLSSQEFIAFVERIKRDLNINIAYLDLTPSCPEVVFKMHLSPNNLDNLAAAKDLLEDFLISRNINVYPPPAERARSDSFASAFPHFANKLISTPGAESGPGGPASSAALENGLSQYQAELAARFNDGGRLRGAASSPSLKALFDSPAGFGGNTSRVLGHHQSQSFAIGGSGSGANGPFGNGGMNGSIGGPLDAPGLALGNGLGNGSGSGLGNGAGIVHRNGPLGGPVNATNPSHSPIVGSSLYSSPYGDSMPGGISSDVWGVQPRQGTLSNAAPPVSPSVAFPRQQYPQPVAPGPHTQHYARQSDDFGYLAHSGNGRGPVDAYDLDDGSRNARNGRSAMHSHGNRTQSLDISKMSAQQAALDANAYVQQRYGAPATGNGFGVRTPGHTGGPAYGFPSPFGGPVNGANGARSPYTHQPPRAAPGHGHGHSPAASISRLPPSASGSSQVPAQTVDEVSRMLSGIQFPH